MHSPVPTKSDVLKIARFASSKKSIKKKSKLTNSSILLNHPLNPIQPHLQRLHLRAIREPHKMMTRTIKQISPLTRVQVEEDTRDNDDALFQTRLEEVQSVGDLVGETFKVEPEVESAVGDGGDFESHGAQTGYDVIAFFLGRD